jgi:hypothetical protein
LKSSDAASTYLTKNDASSTYLKSSDAASTYLKSSDASTTYLTQNAASSTYATKAEIPTQTDLMIQKHSDLTSGTISLNKNVSIYRRTVSSATTFTFSTTALGLNSSTDTATFELKLKMSSVATITFPSSVKWQNAETPDLSETGIYYFVFRTDDGGSTWYGNCQGKWAA